MHLTIAESRVDAMQAVLVDAVRAVDKLKRIERELAEVRQTLDYAAETIYNATIYDPEGERGDDDA